RTRERARACSRSWLARVLVTRAAPGGHEAGAKSRREASMSETRLTFQKLDAYVVAKEIARRVHVAKIGDRELRDQATRAAKSTFLRLAEGLPNDGAAIRRKYFTEANASLHELLAAMDLAATIETVREDDARGVQE